MFQEEIIFISCENFYENTDLIESSFYKSRERKNTLDKNI